MLGHSRFEEVIPIYAVGALDGDELIELEQHIGSGCKICHELLKENEKVASHIPYSLTTTSPPSRVKERLFERIKSEKTVRKETYARPKLKGNQTFWYGIAGAVALALIILLLVSNLSLRGKINDQLAELNDLTTQIATQRKGIKSLEKQLENSRLELSRLTSLVSSNSEIMSFLENPSVVVVNLVNLQPELKTRGRVLWNTENNQAFFYGLNLPETPVGKTYQLWAIADDKPVSIGVFSVDDKGNNIMKLGTLPEAGQIKKFAVTLEPSGGVPQPTGEMYLIGDS